MLLQLDTLHQLFAGHTSAKPIRSRGICRDCGGEVEIEICRTTGGYGLQGGILYEPEPKKFTAKCTRCYQRGPELILGDKFEKRYASSTAGVPSTTFFCSITQ